MTLPTEIVNCDITQASNVEFPASSSSIEFRLSAIELDVALNQVIPRSTVSFPLDDKGQATATLWPNSRGVSSSFYYVFASLQSGIRVPLGTVFITENGGPFDLADILVTGVPASNPSLFSPPYRIGIQSGNAGSPGLAFADQSNTGIFRPAASVLALSVNGTERVRFTTSGLQVTGLLTGTAVVQSDTDNTANRLVKVGWLGMGAARAILVDDLNNATQGGLHSRWDTSTSNVPSFFSGNQGGCFTLPGHSGGREVQIAYENQGTNKLRLASRQNRAGTWQPWYQIYHSNSILGTVSESAGVPTGAVIQRGSNANGEFVRFADGTQICWVNQLTTSASADTTWTFPAAFSYPASPARHAVQGGVATTLSNAFRLILGGTANGTQINVNALNTSNSRVVANVYLSAIGRWF
jgi:hypothetical protein